MERIDELHGVGASAAEAEAFFVEDHFPVTLTYKAIDGFRRRRTFKTLAGARKFAQRYVGETPELGFGYAVSADGVGTIVASRPVLEALFPKLVGGLANQRVEVQESYLDQQRDIGDGQEDSFQADYEDYHS